MRAERKTRVDEFHGLNAQTHPELLEPKEFQKDQNGDRRRDRSWRVRRGYSRLNDADGAGMSYAGAEGNVIKRLVPFERDDDTIYLVYSGGVVGLQAGDSEEVEAQAPGETE
jgi:hypothetical protein